MARPAGLDVFHEQEVPPVPASSIEAKCPTPQTIPLNTGWVGRRARHIPTMSAMAVTCTCCSMSVDWWVRLRSHPDLPICHDCLAGLNGQRDGQMQLMTGTWLATGFEPIFGVADMTRSVAWFEKAGFEVSLHDDTYAFAHRNRDLTIHLAQTPRASCRVTALSTSIVKTLTGWRRSGDRPESKSTVPGTRITASGKDRSPTPTGISFDSAHPFVRPMTL